ncbi:MAG TPA: outer membrane lipid asymmetry maintenance protein MlaD [Xanthomonadaceae bacterium]|nr:outer membrane lipid asymmetry maintenance protein MlaD [Xanthomonadaceae bacterium]
MASGLNRVELSVGAFIIMGFACAVVLAFASTNLRNRLTGEQYTVTARFANSGELKPRAPVKIAGVKIGEVSEIRLDPGNYEAIATLSISHEAGELPADSSAAIYTSGLLGERYVGITPGGDLEPLRQGDEIFLTQSAMVLEQLIGKYMFGSGGSGEGGAAAAVPNPGAAPAPTQAPGEPVEPEERE